MDPIWEKMFRGRHVQVTLEDVTVHRMREIKAAFPELSTPAAFMQGLLIGDMDAVAAALWVDGQVKGQPVGRMLELDFNPTEFDNVEPAPAPKKKPNPPKADTSAQTP